MDETPETLCEDPQPVEDGAVALSKEPGSIMSLSGILHHPGMRSFSIEEMDEAVGQFLAADDERICKGEALED